MSYSPASPADARARRRGPRDRADPRHRSSGRHRGSTPKREQITGRINDLPQPRRRRGREQDSDAVERAHLTGALQAANHELDAVLSQRERLARELGDPSEVRAERDGLHRALTKLTRAHAEIRDELVEREAHAPSAWATRTFGERPDEPRLRNEWEQGVRHIARYRLQYEITDHNDPLGTQPEPPEQQREWQRAREALHRSARRLGHDTGDEHDLAIEIGP
jgi:hypothetical protein